ncbi:MAG: DUF948 domain-containing protein [Candidatus Paceibacterota bacterium]|jgi:uncharacterized protein YoxC
METVLKADIFFFVSTIAVVILAIFLAILLYYAISAFRRIKLLVKKVEGNLDNVNEEVKEIIIQIKESFLFNLFFPKKKQRKK